MPSGHSLLRRANAVSVFILAAAVLAIAVWSDQTVFDSDILAVYKKVEQFGEDCEYATGVWRDGDSFDVIKARPHVFTKLKMPYRSAEKKPQVLEDGYLITHCTANFSSLDKTGYGWMNLGMIFGSSALYVDGTLRAVTSEKKFLELPLLPADRHEKVDVLLISQRDKVAMLAGLASLVPLAYGNSQTAADNMLKIMSRSWLELPMTRSNFCLGLLVFFGVVWFAGIRYSDVGWMAVMLSSVAFISAGDYLIEQRQIKEFVDVRVLAYVPLTFALGAFSFSFLRIPFRQRWVEAAMVVSLVVYAIIYFSFKGQRLITLNTSDLIYWSVSAVTLSVSAVLGWRKSSTLPGRRKWRTRVMCLFNLAMAGMFCFMFVVIDSQALILGNVLTIFAAFVFSIFLALDLVVFQRQYFQERDLRQKSDGEVKRLQDTLTVGGAIQTLLLPSEGTRQVGPYRMECRYLPHGSLAGDWYDHWETDSGVTLIFGDVTGKGPAAALAVSTIMTVLHEAKKSAQSAEAVVQRLHGVLAEIFRGHLFSTASVVEARSDGAIRYASFGAEGWMHMTRGKARLLVSRGALLGSQGEFRIRWSEAKLAPGDSVIGYTDGFVDGSQSQKNWLSRVNASNLAADDFGGVFTLAEASRREFANEDDRTMAGLIFCPEAAGLIGEKGRVG